MKTLLCAVAALFTTASALLAQTAPPVLPDPFVGHWRWPTLKVLMDIRADGSAHGIETGVWKVVPSQANERKYQISWRGGAGIDFATLSKDGKKLSVKNLEGLKFTAERVD